MPLCAVPCTPRKQPRGIKHLAINALAAASASGERPPPPGSVPKIDLFPDMSDTTVCQRRQLVSRLPLASVPLCGSVLFQSCQPAQSQQNSCFISRCVKHHHKRLLRCRLLHHDTPLPEVIARCSMTWPCPRIIVACVGMARCGQGVCGQNLQWSSLVQGASM